MSAKKITVLGGGESGVGAAVLAKKKGFEVWLSDFGTIKKKYKDVLSHHDIEWEERKHSESAILNADEVIKSPGIPETVPIVQKLMTENIPVISEIEFALRFTKAKIIGITGTNGKTTTTLLTHHILAKAGLDVCLAGNVGKSLAAQLAERDYEYCVLELSSFQLDGMFQSRVNLAVLLNITPDHLDRYETLENYVQSKFRIAQNQSGEDAFIYCADDPNIRNAKEGKELKARQYPFSITEKVKEGAFLNNEELNININNETLAMSIHELALQGRHNIYNSMAAGIISRILEIRKTVVRESLSDFQNVEHRLEVVTKVHGIEFINDSKATNLNATWYALESMNTPVIWIVGGVDKGNDYGMVKDIVKSKVKAIICLGEDNSKIHEAFDGEIDLIVDTKSADEAVKTAYRMGKHGDTVLLSPACASFDLFDNYEDRGQQFKRAVYAL